MLTHPRNSWLLLPTPNSGINGSTQPSIQSSKQHHNLLPEDDLPSIRASDTFATMEKLVDAIMAFPSAPNLPDAELARQADVLLNVLNKTPASTLASNVDLLSLLNPGVNSLGYLYALVAKLDRQPIKENWGEITSFLETFDARQIQFAHNEFRRLVEGFCKHAMDIDKPLLAVRPLKKAILRSEPTRFSFMHSPFLRLCIRSKCYRDALAVLDIDILEFPGNKKGDASETKKEVIYQDVLTYFLYAGMIHLGLKDWRRAVDMLTYAISIPGSACSAIQVEAYKKYILTGILLDGSVHRIPKVCSVMFTRTYNALCRPYEYFAEVFMSGDPEVFKQEAALMMDVFQRDGNTGLAMQCMDAFKRMKIIALQDTYVTLSVEEIAKKCPEIRGVPGKEETENIILGMIERDELRASLSHTGDNSQTTVHFHNNPISELRTLRALESQILRTVSVTNMAKDMNRKLGLSREYIMFANRSSKLSMSAALSRVEDPDAMEFDYGQGGWDDDGDETVMQDFDDEI
ncbi:hypothetical protein RUND412_008045 [Rhizina undulata]